MFLLLLLLLFLFLFFVGGGVGGVFVVVLVVVLLCFPALCVYVSLSIIASPVMHVVMLLLELKSQTGIEQ